MEKRMISYDKRIAVFASIFLAACLILGGRVFAYFTDAKQVENRVAVGGVHIGIEEVFTPPPELLPGTVIRKDVKVKCLGPNRCYVRVMAVFSDNSMGRYCEVDWNTEDWVKQADGYYYYRKPIAEGESTASLFTQIRIKDDTPKAQIRDFDVIVYGEGYQSEGYLTWQEAWEAYKENKP